MGPSAAAGYAPSVNRRIALISTGGTIEKVYDELGGMLVNKVSNLDVLLAGLEVRGLELVRVPLMNKDSLHMSEADHDLVARTAGAMAEAYDGVVVVHGTDRLTVTGDHARDVGHPAGAHRAHRSHAAL